MDKRIVWIDYAKTIGIFLVVLAHTPLLTSAQNFIYVFHMPLFFFLSGYLFSFERHPELKGFIRHRAIQLLLPYLFFSVITYLFWLFLGRKFGNDAGVDIPFYQPLIGMLYGNGLPAWMPHCIPLWFLPCLFIVEIIYYILFKTLKNRMIYIPILAILAYLFIQVNPIRLPWSINTALVALSIYAFGNLSENWIKSILDQKFFLKIILFLAALTIVFLVAQKNGRINMHIHYYGNYFLFLTGALSGIALMILLGSLLEQFLKRNFWVEFFSKNTLIVLGFHLIAASFIKGITVFIFGQSLEIYHEKFWINVGFSLISLLVLIPLIYFLNYYVPALVGNKNKSNSSKLYFQNFLNKRSA